MYNVRNVSKYVVEIFVNGEKKYLKPKGNIVIKNIEDLKTNFKDYIKITPKKNEKEKNKKESTKNETSTKSGSTRSRTKRTTENKKEMKDE